MHRLILLLLCLASNALTAPANHWPGWLGPNRDGWVKDFTPPKQWPAKLQRNWQVPVGEGYGSSLVVGDRVFLHTRQGEDEVLRCLRLADGSEIWRKPHPTPFKIGGGGEYHGKGPKACPVYADGRLFVMSISGTLSAWDAANGKPLWRRDYRSRFTKNYPFWGASGSPLVDGPRVIAHFGNDKEGVLAALDAKTGRELWTQGNDGTCYSSPFMAAPAGVRQVIEWNHRALVGVDPVTGRKLWDHPFPHLTHNQNMPTPSFHNGRVLLGGENRGLHSIQPILRDGKWTTTTRWSQRGVALDMASTIMNNGHIYGLSHFGRGRFFCVNPKDGKILWQTDGREANHATFLAFPGHVMALTDRGQLHLIAANPKAHQRMASWKVSETPTWAPPVLLPNGQLLIKGKDTLTCWKLSGGN